MDERDLIGNAMDVLKSCVKAGRKLKDGTRLSLKAFPFCVSFRIPFELIFSMDRDSHAEIIRRLLKAESVYMEEDGFDGPFVLSEISEVYPHFAGVERVDCVEAKLWTREPLWG